jgi:hypothetical protein
MTNETKHDGKPSLTLEEEVRFLREREAAITHFLYGVAFGLIIFSIACSWGRNER